MISSRIDATLLKSQSTLEDYDECLLKAFQLDCRAVVVPTSIIDDPMIDLAHLKLKIKIATVVGFPLGNNSTQEKLDVMTRYQDKVDEFDIVLNVGWMKSGYWDLVQQELNMLCAHKNNCGLKFIIESPVLDGDDIFHVSSLIVLAQQKNYRVKFIKTATGFSGDTNVAQVKVIKSALGQNVNLGIKVSGGVRTKEQIAEFLEAGATIFGVGYPHFVSLLGTT